jgi:hypothetical protein
MRSWRTRCNDRALQARCRRSALAAPTIDVTSKEIAMPTWKQGAVLILAAATTSVAVAAAPAPGASAAAADGYAIQANALGSKKVYALAQKNERMSKCKVMKGDEKTGCEADARAKAKSAAHKHATASSAALPR